MSTSTLELQKAVYAALSAALMVPVYDDIPEGTSPPYVVIGDIAEEGDYSHDTDGRQALVTVHVWSAYRGMKEAREIGGEIISALHFKELTVTGYRPVPLVLEFFDVLRDPGGTLRHGILRFRAWIRP